MDLGSFSAIELSTMSATAILVVYPVSLNPSIVRRISAGKLLRFTFGFSAIIATPSGFVA